MKNFYYILLLLLLSSKIILAQWYGQESGTVADLRGLWFVDSLNGWACGDSGIVLYTTNGGQEWEKQNSTVNVILEDIFFWDLQTGWAVGDSGTIINTTNGGINWEEKVSSVSTLLRKIKFADSLHGMIVGNKVTFVSTEDGGSTWQGGSQGTRDIYSLVYKLYWNWMFCVETWHGSNLGTVFRTTDNGITWDSLAIIPLAFNVYAYVEPQTFYLYSAACKHGYMLTSTDEGVNWRIGIIDGEPIDTTINFYGTTLDSTSFKLWGVGSTGKIVTSIDTGKTWATVQSGINVDLYDVTFPAEHLGWAVGDSGIILRYDHPTGVNNLLPDVLPSSTQISDPYPNPFNSSVTIRYSVPQSENISLVIYNSLGQLVRTLFYGYQHRGNYGVRWDGRNEQGLICSSGLYLAVLRTQHSSLSKKIILLK